MHSIKTVLLYKVGNLKADLKTYLTKDRDGNFIDSFTGKSLDVIKSEVLRIFPTAVFHISDIDSFRKNNVSF